MLPLIRSHITEAPTPSVRPIQLGFAINTSGCRIPKFDPWDESISDFLQVRGPLKCKSKPDLTYLDGKYIRINKTALKLYYDNELDFCHIYEVARTDESDDNYDVNATLQGFKEEVLTKAEYNLVRCFRKEKSIYSNYYAVINRKPHVEKRIKTLSEKISNATKNKLNVLIFGLDSMSSLNYKRQLTKTREFVTNSLGAIELNGYNKVADNTFPNMVPLLSGKYVAELPWDARKDKDKPFDEYDMIWKNFSKHGYRTLLTEDWPDYSTFNYLKPGFWVQPTDYYMRPMALAIEDDKLIWNSDRNCIRNKLEPQFHLDYVTAFTKEFRNDSFFGFCFLSHITHDDVNGGSYADHVYLKFFQNLKHLGILDNTVVIFMSDHGMRFGDLPLTTIGRLEVRMPFMSFIFPKWFKHKYPTHIRNLLTNKWRLTTQFDVHYTLRHILELQGSCDNFRNHRSMSLFYEVPSHRTCEDADILPHWCTCDNYTPVSQKDPLVQRSVKTVINFLNKKLEKSNKSCANLTLKKINRSSKSNLTKILYQLQFVTSPGGGVFGSTTEYNKDTDSFKITGSVSRLNKYGNQSKCIDDFSLKKFCFCL